MSSAIALLRNELLLSLPRRLCSIEELEQRARLDGWSRPAIDALRLPVHALAGTASTYGILNVGEAAGEADRLLAPEEAVHPAAIEQALARLRAAVETERRHEAGESTPAFAPAPIDAATSKAASPPPAHAGLDGEILLLLDDPRPGASDLPEQLRHFGYRCRALPSAAALTAWAHHHPPRACLVTFTGRSSSPAHAVMALVCAAVKPVPVVAIVPADDTATRFRAALAGAAALLSAPLTAAALADTLERMERPEEPLRLLVVSADGSLLADCRRLLPADDISLDAATGPEDALERLEAAHPDLILIDGRESSAHAVPLARAIRFRPSQVDIPIVIMTEGHDEERHRRLLTDGVDDIVHLPLDPALLPALVRNRARRSRQLRAFMTRDGLTGLANHTTIEEHLRVEVARAWRDRSPLSYALIDLDRFKQINDGYGHTAGDQVLVGLGHLLKQRLRQSDMAGRYGGDELSIILPGTDGETGLALVDSLRSRFGELRYRLRGEDVRATFSAGVASYPECGSVEELAEAADEALYAAKRQGRNRVVLAHRRRRRVLVIDDDEGMALLIRKLLTAEGYDVQICGDGMEGLQLASAGGVDMVISDLLLPHMHGFEICRRLKSDPALRRIPVILMTGVYRKYRYRVEAIGCGAEDFLEKPIEPATLLQAVRGLLPTETDGDGGVRRVGSRQPPG